jgi:predicted metalloendopeptidase
VLNLTALAFGQSSCAVVAVVKWNCPVTPGIGLPEKQAEFSPLIINAVSLYYNCKKQDMMGVRDSILALQVSVDIDP